MMQGAGMRRATDGLALGGVSSPFWRDGLDAAGNVAASLVPILSAIWLFVQISRFLIDWKRARKNNA